MAISDNRQPLGDKNVRSTRYAIISSGTSGSLTLPTDSQIVLDDFGGGTDAVITTVTAGYPTEFAAYNASSEMVATTLDVFGNWVLSSAPVTYPVAIVYRVRQKFRYYDSESLDIITGITPGLPGVGVEVGGTTGQALIKTSNTDYDTEWATITTAPPGSDTQLIYNDGGNFGADSNFIFDKTNKSLNVQTTLKLHPLHVNAATGTAISNFVTGSISQIAESIDASPTGSVTVIPEFPAPSGSGAAQNLIGTGFVASAQSIDYRISPAILGDAQYFISGNSEIINVTDIYNDSSPFSVDITLPASVTNQDYWVIARQVNGAGFNDSVLVPVGPSTYEDVGFSGSASTTAWPTYYTITYTAPVNPTGGMTGFWNTGFFGFTASNLTFGYEVRAYTNISGTPYSDDANVVDAGSFTDPNDASQGAADVIWNSGTADGYIVRFTIDAGSTWYYFDAGGSTSFVWDNQASDAAAQATWDRVISAFAGVEYAFKCYGKTLSPSGGVAYSSSADTYYGAIVTPGIGHIFVHTYTGMPSGGGKTLADYNSGVANGRNVSGSTLFDIGYAFWSDGASATPNHYGFTGTAQVREYKLYGYSGSLLIYSATALVLNTVDTGGYKTISGTFAFPSGVTIVKITRGINGAAHNVSQTFNSPTVAFTDDDLNGSWGGNTTVAPTVAVPTTGRFDFSRATIGQSTDNLAIIDVTGSGVRYPSISFGVASSTGSAIATTLVRISAESSTGYIQIGAPRVQGYTSLTMGTQSWQIGNDNQFNMQKSSTVHTTVWGGDASNPMAYFYSAGDSNRGTVYFGQNSTAFGSTSKVCIAPSAGGTIGLHFRRTSGATGANILMDENGSFRGGWNPDGRMFLNNSSVSSVAILYIGGTSGVNSIILGTTSSIPTDTGGISFDGTNFVGNSSATKRNFVRMAGVTQGTSTSIPYFDANGFLVSSVNLQYDGTNLRTGIFLAGNGSASAPSISLNGDTNTGFYFIGGDNFGLTVGGALRITWSTTVETFSDGYNIATGTTTGTKIGTATTQKLGFWNVNPIVQPTTAIAASTLVGNAGTTITDTDTFDGYTLKQIVKALRNSGLLA